MAMNRQEYEETLATYGIPVLTRKQKWTLRKVFLRGLLQPAAVYAALRRSEL